MLKAQDIMRTPVISVTPTAPLAEVTRTLVENGISGCPVLDYHGRLRGVISRTDVLEAALCRDLGDASPTLLSLAGAGEEDERWGDLPALEEAEAQDLMAGDVECVAPGTPLVDVAGLMSRERIHRVPVVEQGRVVGIITSLDLLEVMARDGHAAEMRGKKAGPQG